MRRTILGILVLALLVGGAYAVTAARKSGRFAFGPSTAQASANTAERTVVIQLLSFEGCPSTAVARKTLHRVIASAGIRAVIQDLDLGSEATPESLRGWGSPTILVDGRDVGGQEGPTGAACRVYRDEAGRMLGSPSAAMVRAALSAGAVTQR